MRGACAKVVEGAGRVAISRLVGTICAALGLASLQLAGAAARELRLSHQLPTDDGRHKAALEFAAELKKRGSSLTISIHPSGSLIADPSKQYEALVEEKIELTIYPMAYAAAKFPEMAVVTMPGVPANAGAAALLKGSEFETKLQELCWEKGFRILGWWWLDGGMASGIRPVTGPATIKGLTARSGGGGGYNTMLIAAGADLMAMPLSEVAGSLREGRLGVAQNSFETLLSYRIQDAAKFVTVGAGYGTLTAFTPLLISKSVWVGLREEERQALEDAAAVSDISFQAGQRDAHETAVKAFSRAGAKVQPLSFEDYAAWLEIARETAWKDYRAISPRTRELFDSLLRSFINSTPRRQ